MKTLFISDLHLSGDAKAACANFLLFLQTHAKEAEALYILGDLFEVWVGDDEKAVWIDEICLCLKQLSAKIYLMQGNRDFLLGKNFAERCNAVLLPDPTVIELYGVSAVLTHGDVLCTEDVAYQRWRKLSHCNLLQRFFLRLPLAWRQKIALALRTRSQRYTYPLFTENSAKMDVSLTAVEVMVQKYHAALLIHGHTHRPAVHYAQTYTRFVLPDWHTRGGMLIAKSGEMMQLRIF